MEAQDYEIDSTYDLVINANRGFFRRVPSDERHVSHLLLALPGHYRHAPQIGAGLQLFISATTTNRPEMERAIRETLTADGYRINRLDLSDPMNPRIDFTRN